MNKHKTDEAPMVTLSAEPLPEDGLGARVRQIREQKALTHDSLSSLTKLDDPEGRGISRTTIRGYELGTYKPGAREVRILSAALEVSPTWLILGTSDTGSDGTGSRSKLPGDKGSKNFRWGDIAFTAIAGFQLGDAERKIISELVETMYRLKIGEESARRQKAFIQDFCDVLQDFITDKRDATAGPFGFNATPADIKLLFQRVVEDFRTKHGDPEANLLLASFGPFIESWVSSNK